MKTIVVTGGNRGIGLEISKQLVAMGHQVILTARTASKGELAAEEIGASFMQLDVSDAESISSFCQLFTESFDHLDVLINNAGIFIDKNRGAADVNFDDLVQTMETNTYGPWRLSIGLLDMLKKSSNPRIINMSSGLGAMEGMSGGYPSYRMSKVAMNAMTVMLQAELGDSFQVNSMCPGWVRTDMGGSDASRSVEEGAETAVWLATEEIITSGKFLRDKKIIPW